MSSTTLFRDIIAFLICSNVKEKRELRLASERKNFSYFFRAVFPFKQNMPIVLVSDICIFHFYAEKFCNKELSSKFSKHN